MRGRTLMLLAAVAGIATACEDSTDPEVKFAATLTDEKEVPPANAPNASGSFTATLEGNILTYNITYTGLTGNSTGAHIHGPATTAQAVGVLVDFNAPSAGRTITLGATSGTGSGTLNIAPTAVITATVSGDSLRKLLDLGLLYANVHTPLHGNGEIRGQITRQ